MKGFLKSFGVALCGLATSVLVAIANVAFSHWTGFDLFGFSFWLIVPVGAAVLGGIAASGYYFGAVYFHRRATRVLFFQMVVIAGITQCLIYWLGYATLVLDDGRRLATLISFSDYLDVLLTKAHYRLGRGQVDTGEAGSMGYWLAGVHFIGFLFGGFVVYVMLQIKAACTACELYLTKIATKNKVFPDSEAAGVYYENVFTLPTDSPEFAHLIQAEAKVDNVEHGAMQIDTALLGCPHCKTQTVKETVQGYNGKSWKFISELERRIDMPAGVDLAPVFRG